MRCQSARPLPIPLAPIDREFATSERRTNENEAEPEDMEKRNLRALRRRSVFHGLGIVACHMPDEPNADKSKWAQNHISGNATNQALNPRKPSLDLLSVK